MILWLTDEEEGTLAMPVDADEISKQEAISRAIQEAATRRLHVSKVQDLSSAVRERYADLLDRFGR